MALAVVLIVGTVSLALAGMPVAAVLAGMFAIAGPFGLVVGLGRRFEETLYQDPNSPINQQLRGTAGVWPYGGGAVAVGFRDPKYGPVLPTVPDDDPHRTTAPEWAARVAPALIDIRAVAPGGWTDARRPTATEEP